MTDATGERTFRGRSADERRAVRRAALEDAALDLVAATGWASATMTAICRRAGLTERYFYESFENRDALFLALVERTRALIERAVVEAASDPGDDADSRIRSVVDAALGALLDDPRLGRVAMLEGLESPVVRDARRAGLDRFEEQLQDLGPVLFGWDPGDPGGLARAAASLVGATQELLTRRLNGTLPGTDAELAAHLVALAGRMPAA